MTGTRTPDRWRCTAAILALLAAASLPLALQAQSEPPALDFKVDVRGQEPAPRILEHRAATDGAPLWVSAEAATNPNGTVDWELLGEEARKGFQMVRKQFTIPYSTFLRSRVLPGVVEKKNPDGTSTTFYHYGVGSIGLPGTSWESLEELAREARAVYRGTVLGVTEGFFDGGPGSLLTVRIDEVLLADDNDAIDSRAYVYYPQARFSIGDLNFWKSNPSYPTRPEPGDPILVAPDERFSPDAERLTVLPHPSGLFLEVGERSSVFRPANRRLALLCGLPPDAVRRPVEVSAVTSMARRHPPTILKGDLQCAS